MDRIRQLLQEAAVELIKWETLIPGYPEYISFVDTSGEGCGGLWMGGT